MLCTVAVFVVLQFCSAWLVAVGCSNCAGAVVIGCEVFMKLKFIEMFITIT